MEGPTQVVIGGVHYELNREEGTIEIKDYSTLVLRPGDLLYLLTQYGAFEFPPMPEGGRFYAS